MRDVSDWVLIEGRQGSYCVVCDGVIRKWNNISNIFAIGIRWWQNKRLNRWQVIPWAYRLHRNIVLEECREHTGAYDGCVKIWNKWQVVRWVCMLHRNVVLGDFREHADAYDGCVKIWKTWQVVSWVCRMHINVVIVEDHDMQTYMIAI